MKWKISIYSFSPHFAKLGRMSSSSHQPKQQDSGPVSLINRSALSQIDVAAVSSLTVTKLKFYLATNGLPTSGPKHVLVKRLEVALAERKGAAVSEGEDAEEAGGEESSGKEDAGHGDKAPEIAALFAPAPASAGPEPVPDDAIEKAVAAMPQSQRDLLVGQQLRKAGGTME